MANWCQQQLFFFGQNVEAIALAHEEFKKMQLKESKDFSRGYVPEFMNDKAEDGYFYAIDVTGEAGEQITYETKWSPNLKDLVKIAQHFGVNFEVEYQESGCGVYGRAVYEDGELTCYDLDNSDHEQYQYDDETETYTFRGKEYESDSEILETLLEEKIKATKII